MATKTFSVIVEGTAGGVLDLVFVKLNDVQVTMSSNDGGITWQNNNDAVTYNSPLNVFMSCKASNGTKWDMAVQDTNAADSCYKKTGVTGGKLADGRIIPGYSEIKENTNC